MSQRSFRLFVSSTFQDFAVERQVLNNIVFPEIRDYCLTKGFGFQMIDLRWGVSTESALLQNTVPICLEEVRRCRELSPRPNFLVMVGDRYGWTPLPYKIAVGDFSEILANATKAERTLLGEWYLLDMNELGGVYYLKPRTGVYTDDSAWSNMEDTLRAILLRSAQQAGFLPERINAFLTSATEQEVMEGFLNHQERCENTIAVFRNRGLPCLEDSIPVEKFKKRIVGRMAHDGCQENIIHLNVDDTYLIRFQNAVVSALKHNIDQEIERLLAMPQYNSKETANTILSNCRVYCSRPDIIRRIHEYVTGPADVPMFVHGTSGSGKTTILADYVKHCEISVISVFWGHGIHSYSLFDALKYICSSIQTLYNIHSKAYSANYSDIAAMFDNSLYSVPKNEKLLIVIDGLDMFRDLDLIKENVFPIKLPSNVRIILSSAEESVIARFCTPSGLTETVDHLSPEQSVPTLNALLKSRNRCISASKQQTIVEESLRCLVTPLQLHMIFALCEQWRSADTQISLATSQKQLCLQYIRWLFERRGHDTELVLYALAFVTASPYGVTEDELLHLLMLQPDIKEHFSLQDRHHHDLQKLPFVVWSRLYYDLQHGLTLSVLEDETVVRFRHQLFSQVITEYFPEYLKSAEEILVKFYQEQNNYRLSVKIPNMRKALNLPTLLLNAKRYYELNSLMSDLRFVDVLVKIGHLDRAISFITSLMAQQSTDKNGTLVKILSCLQYNHGRLICYRNDFLPCAYDDGLQSETVPFISSREGHSSLRQLYFPYSTNAELSWSNDASKYVTIYGSYVYIGCAKTAEELGRIYLPRTDQGSLMEAKRVLWIDNDHLAVSVNTGALHIYQLVGTVPREVSHFPQCITNCAAHYSPANKLLLYIYDGFIFGRDPFTGNIAYKIPVRKESANFCVDEACGKLYICKTKSKIGIYRIADAASVGHIDINVKYGWNLYSCGWHVTSEGNVLLYKDSAPGIYLLANVSDHSLQFIMPPNLLDSRVVDSFILGKESIVLRMNDCILHIALNRPYEMHYYPVNGATILSWVREDEIIVFATKGWLCFLNISDFIPFTPNGAYCFSENLNLVSHAFLLETTGSANVSFFRKYFLYLQAKKHHYVQQFDTLGIGKDTQIVDKATLMVCAKNGTVASLYEGKDALTVHDSAGKCCLYIDKLALSINDTIKQLHFSDDSSLLLLWRDKSLCILNVVTGILVSQLDISHCDVAKVIFKTNDAVQIEFQNGSVHTWLIHEKNAQFTPLCTPIHEEGNSAASTLQAHEYRSSHYRLSFSAGQFYLNGLCFQTPYCDFSKCLQQEKQLDPSTFFTFLREKNDLSSFLFELPQGRLMLVSRLLNSVIGFSISQMQIIATYKVYGNIIGVRRYCDTALELYIDRAPGVIVLDINNAV